MPIVKRAQELAAHHRTAPAIQHLYRDALYSAATQHNFDLVGALLDSGSHFDLKELSQIVDTVCLPRNLSSTLAALDRLQAERFLTRPDCYGIATIGDLPLSFRLCMNSCLCNPMRGWSYADVHSISPLWIYSSTQKTRTTNSVRTNLSTSGFGSKKKPRG